MSSKYFGTIFLAKFIALWLTICRFYLCLILIMLFMSRLAPVSLSPIRPLSISVPSSISHEASSSSSDSLILHSFPSSESGVFEGLSPVICLMGDSILARGFCWLPVWLMRFSLLKGFDALNETKC
jgi:hypothetical protein